LTCFGRTCFATPPPIARAFARGASWQRRVGIRLGSVLPSSEPCAWLSRS
jgi:hypothetical protein